MHIFFLKFKMLTVFSFKYKLENYELWKLVCKNKELLTSILALSYWMTGDWLVWLNGLKITEAAPQRCSYKKVFWKYAENLQENTYEVWL